MNNLVKNFEYDDEYIQLKDVLNKNLPHMIYGWNNKNNFDIRIKKERYKSLDKDLWIEYNQDWVNFLIFDIDNDNLENTLNKCYEIGLEPSFGCSTSKGCHIFYHLENGFDYNKSKALKYARDIKLAITIELGADPKGSNRIKGIWRNPLAQESFFVNDNLKYKLNDFNTILYKHFNSKKTQQQQFNTYINKSKINSNNFKFEDGNRNNFLFYSGMIFSKNKSYSEDEIYNYLYQLNQDLALNNSIDKIEDKDIKATSRSIYKYNLQGRNYIKSKVIDNNYNIGAMKYEKIKNLSKDEYIKEVKKRQKESGQRTQEILKGKNNMTKIEAALKMAKEKEEKHYKIIINFITGKDANNYKKKNGTWNYKMIGKDLKIDYRTISKHIKKYEENLSI